MRELPGNLLPQAFSPNHDPAGGRGTIIADTVEGAMAGAGESIEGVVQPGQLTE